MKKLALTLAIVLGLSMTTFADGGGLFKRGETPEQQGGVYGTRGVGPVLPGHDQTNNQNAPLGTGIAVLAALGAAYLIGKRRKED